MPVGRRLPALHQPSPPSADRKEIMTETSPPYVITKREGLRLRKRHVVVIGIVLAVIIALAMMFPRHRVLSCYEPGRICVVQDRWTGEITRIRTEWREP